MQKTTYTKPSLNPFEHIANGLSNLLKYNLLTAIFTFLGLIGFFVLLSILAGFLAGAFISGGPATSLPFIYVLGIFMFLIYLGFIVWGSLSVAKIFLASAAATKVSLGDITSAVAARFKVGYLSYLSLLAVYEVAMLIFTASAFFLSGSSILAMVLPFLYFGMILIAVFRIIYLDYALIDSNVPAKVRAVFSRSSDVWLRSAGATLLLIIVLFVCIISLAFATGGFRYYDVVNPGKLALLIIGQIIVTLSGLAGLSSIYQTVAVDPAQAAPQVPIAPTAPLAPMPPKE